MRFLVAVLLPVVAAAQDLVPDAAQLTHVRARLAALPEDHRAIVVAVVAGHEPVILCRGSCEDGSPVTDETLVPAGRLARLLIADALHVKHGGDLTASSGVKVGSLEPTLMQLVGGMQEVPDYWDWRADSKALTAADILACSATVSRCGFEPECNRAGMAELMLLEPACLDARVPTWPAFLRVTLSPRVGGLDPVDAGSLPEAGTRSPAVLTEIARHAKPAPMRLLLRAQDLANWWSWRTREAIPVPDGARSGYSGKLDRRGGVARWTFEDFWNTPVKTLGTVYPDQRCALLCILIESERRGPNLDDDLMEAFETDLWGQLEPEVLLGVGGRLVGLGNARPLSAWMGHVWKTAEGAAHPCEIEVTEATHNGLSITFEGVRMSSSQALARGGAMRIVVSQRNMRGGVLWMTPTPGSSGLGSMTAVLHWWDSQHRAPYVLELVEKDGN